MLKNKRLLLFPLVLVLAAIVVLGMRVAYPAHRLVAFILLGLGWIPLIASYRINRRLLRAHKTIIRKKTRPYGPHVVVAVMLLIAFYVTWALFPVEKSPLVDMSPETLRAELQADGESYLMLRRTADDIVRAFSDNRLLERQVDELSGADRETILSLWRDGVMAFFEFDMLKGKYRGFHQIDYVDRPEQHADAFLLAYMAYVVQYDACLRIIGLVDDNEFMETLLNEEGEGIPSDSYFAMKLRITDPNVMLRMNAAAAYYELVKDNVSIDRAVVNDFKERRSRFYHTLGSHADIFVENPLDILERAAFETLFPVQKKVAVQMSYIRTAKRDYLITPEILSEHRALLKPGDILIQRRNWHMTNIGIPGFWPHVALYVGTPEELQMYFSELGFQPLQTMEALYPEAFRALNRTDANGYPLRVMEAIRPGVVFQSLETSAKCDYLGVIRPNLTKAEKFKALMAAFSHYAKPYDLNFDFSTDNELVCSELVYKAYKAAGSLPLETEIINGRLLLPPNRLAEEAVANMGDGQSFSFILFLDAVERDDVIVARGAEAFRDSWKRPKWDVLQK
jgi:hypothetical protein